MQHLRKYFQAVWKMDILMSLLSFLVPNISLTGEVFRHVYEILVLKIFLSKI